MRYPKTVRAAKAVSTDEKAMAAAIFAEIPPRSKGRTPAGTPTIEDALAEMATELRAEGHDYSAATLENYRNIAAWASKGNTSPQGGISWLPVSWSVIREAYASEMSYAALGKLVESGKVTTVDDLRRHLGKQPTRKNQPSEKAKEVSDLAASGQLSDDDAKNLAASLPSDIIEAEANERRSTRVSSNRDSLSREDGMTADEIADADRVIGALQGAVNDLQNRTKDMVEMWWQKHLIDARGSLAAAVHGLRSADLDAEGVRDFGKEMVVEIKDIVGLLEDTLSGNEIARQIEDWLQAQA